MTVLIPFAGLSPVPWKNGGGSTTQIAVGPPDASLDDFDWRISLATIAEDGEFSVFPDIDRTLALVEGAGAVLDIDGEDQVLLCADDPVASFDGDSRVSARLTHGPTTDFNVMTRRERCYHVFGVRRLVGESGFAARGDVSILFLAEGDSLAVSSDDERIGLVRYDAVVFDTPGLWKLEAGQGVIFIVDVFFHD